MGKNNLILVGSSNPTKVNSVSQAFSFVYPNIEFEVLGKPVKSGVSNQPMGEDETLMGAENRMKNLLKNDALFYVGICLLYTSDAADE